MIVRALFSLMGAAALLAALAMSGCGSGEGLTLKQMVGAASGPTPKEQLAMAFDSDDADHRREGVLMLSSHQWGLQEPYLKGYAMLLESDEDPTVRAAAATALGRSKAPGYLETLAAALSDPVPAVQWDAAVALDSLYGQAAIAPLKAAAREDTSADVRAASAWALRHYQREDVADVLLACLSDESFAVQHQARMAMVELAGEDFGYDRAAWQNVRDQLVAGPAHARSHPWWKWFGRDESPEPSVDESLD